MTKDYIANYLVSLPPASEQLRIISKVKGAFSIMDMVETDQANLSETISKLKARILDLAIRGKLVPQDPNDEPASVLLERIRAEKEELIKAGKIKRDKKESVIFKGEDNSYYQKVQNSGSVYTHKLELPRNWIACTITDISYSVGGKKNQINTKLINDVGLIPVISQGQEYIDGYCNETKKAINDVPVLLFGDHTRIVKYIDQPFVIGADGTKLHKVIEANGKYIYYWMWHTATKIDSKGYARHYSLLQKECLNLPPLTEQSRIVEAIETRFALLDQIAESLA